MSYWQIRKAVSIWGTLAVGGNHASGTILFGSAGDTELSRIGANHLRTGDAFTVGGTAGFASRVQASPLNTQGGSALTSNGDIGFDGSQLYYRTGGSIFNLTPDGTIAV